MTTLNFENTDNARGACTRLEGYALDVSPGDMTRYKMTVTEDPDGGYLVTWRRSLWWCGSERGGSVVVACSDEARHKQNATRDYDADIIGALLDRYVR